MRKVFVPLLLCLLLVGSVSSFSFFGLADSFFQGSKSGSPLTGYVVSVDSVACNENADIALGKSASASANSFVNAPKLAVDGRDSTYWESAMSSGSLSVDLGSAKTVKKVRARWSFNSDVASVSKSKVDVSSDGVHWAVVATPTISAIDNGKVQVVEFSPVLARYVRFGSYNWYGSTVKLYSFEVYQSCANTQQCVKDGGYDIVKKGTAKLGSDEKADACSGSTDLIEYYCSADSSKIEWKAVDCGGWCKDGACVVSAADCNNYVKDGDETGVDCGGSCITTCDDGKGCKSNGDCSSKICSAGVCQKKASCTPGFRSGSSYCNDKSQLVAQSDGVCVNNFECSSNLCVGSKCVKLSSWQKIVALVEK